MDLKGILKSLENCPCGKAHTFEMEGVEIGHGVAAATGTLLRRYVFGDRLLLVADRNTAGVARAAIDSLAPAGFSVKTLLYDDLRSATATQVREVEGLCADVDGILSVGTGSLNDICRVAAHTQDKCFCLFATAPSMDGFAADLAPIIDREFKSSWVGRQPDLILADTEILANAPAELKSAGFGDMMAKFLGVFDWRVSHILTGEHYCPAIADLTLNTVRRLMALADKVTGHDEQTAGLIMEALVLSGLAMKLAASSRPASGAEHAVSHYWECNKIARGIWPDFHGKKVGVATVLMNRVYRNVAKRVEKIKVLPSAEDKGLRAAFTDRQWEEVTKLNVGALVEAVDPRLLEVKWNEIRALALEVLPTDGELLDVMACAGATVDPADVGVDDALLEKGLRYHPYMKGRLLLTHLFPQMGLNVMDFLR